MNLNNINKQIVYKNVLWSRSRLSVLRSKAVLAIRIKTLITHNESFTMSYFWCPASSQDGEYAYLAISAL